MSLNSVVIVDDENTFIITSPYTAPAVISLNNLQDVALLSPTDGQVLRYDSSTNKWINIDGSPDFTKTIETLSIEAGKTAILDWSNQTTPYILNLNDVIWFPSVNKLVATSSSSPFLMSSVDGITWEVVANLPPELITARALATNGDTLRILGGSNDGITYTTDLVTFVYTDFGDMGNAQPDNVSPIGGNSFKALTYGNDRWYLISGNGGDDSNYYSFDGLVWYRNPNPPYSRVSGASLPFKVLAITDKSGNHKSFGLHTSFDTTVRSELTYSDDGGYTWGTSLSCTWGVTGIAYSPTLDLYVCIGGRTTAAAPDIQTSTTGVGDWTLATGSAFTLNLYIAWSDIFQRFIVLSAAGNIRTSLDGQNWVDTGVVITLDTVTGLHWIDELQLFVILGKDVPDATTQIVINRQG